jgi:predicted phosphodiesterase
MAKSGGKARKTLLKMLRNSFSGLSQCEEVDVKEAYQLSEKKVRVHLKDYPLQIHLHPDGKELDLYPERPLIERDGEEGPPNYILFDPARYFTEISGFYRLEDGDRITLGSEDPEQRLFLDLPKELPPRKLSITNDEGNLIFKSHVSNPRSCISPLLKDKKVDRVIRWRIKKLQRLRRIFGGPIKLLSDREALSLIREVNEIMETEACRPENSAGRPGGLVTIPGKMQVFIVGDLHAKPDNLLTILSQNGFLETLEAEQACLVILGDAVHNEEEGQYDEMENSLLIMDLIFKLKVRFPKQLFYIRGNHDSFSEDIAKGGVPQGLLWEKTLSKTRGKAYRKEMARFYDALAYVVTSKRVITCHAAPATSAITPEMITNIQENPKLVKQLISNRMMRPGRPSGYTKGDVKRFRKNMGLPPDTPFVVGHTPMSSDDTLWEHVGDIDNHYIAYASDRHQVGVMTQIGDGMYPFRYPVEPISSIIDSLSD